jgi:hypothetical protein
MQKNCLLLSHHPLLQVFIGPFFICLNSLLPAVHHFCFNHHSRVILPNLCTLMMMLWQLDVASSQLLVTDNDFRDPDFRLQLSETVNSLLELRVVPVFNENDAISTRRAPYKVTKSLLQWMYNLVVYRLFPLHE